MKTYQVKIPDSLIRIKNKQVIVHTDDGVMEKDKLIMNVIENVHTCQFNISDQYEYSLEQLPVPTFYVECIYPRIPDKNLEKINLKPILVSNNEN